MQAHIAYMDYCSYSSVSFFYHRIAGIGGEDLNKNYYFVLAASILLENGDEVTWNAFVRPIDTSLLAERRNNIASNTASTASASEQEQHVVIVARNSNV